MKKILMSTAAIAGLAFVVAAPAHADEPALQLGVGGYISGYAVYTDQDNDTGLRSFQFKKDTEVHLNGEVALDNGITAGAHLEMLADRFDGNNAGTGTTVEESYMYLSSAWGRVNFGEEDGIGYLLQVGAPSADDKIDGIRPDLGAFNAATGGTISYAQDDAGYANKLTYITPVFNGFQAGVSYTPTVNDEDSFGPSVSNTLVGGVTQLEDVWEVAGRYEGSFNAIDLALGAGYSNATQERSGPTNLGTDDLESWNVGANIGFGAFGVGAAYTNTNGGVANNGDVDQWVAGVDYTTGPYKLGVSYLNQQADIAGSNDPETDRWTGGVVYEWGPGMTFRGAVQYQDANDVGGVATADGNGTQVTLGTQLEF